MLQCFALYEYIRSLGYFVEVIDLHRPGNPDFSESIRYCRMRTKLGFKGWIKGWIKELLGIRRFSNLNIKPTWNLKAGERFDTFNKQVKLTHPYCSIPELYRNPPQYDIYITGSDQLWNPDQPYCLEPYFLTFIKDKRSVKVSYGTSIGIEHLTNKEKALFKKWLASYDMISTREEQARELLTTITGRTIRRVPDPTFLLPNENWVKMAITPNSHGDYILIFNLGHDDEAIKKGISIAEETGMKVKVLDQNYASIIMHPLLEVVDDAGPLEFIGLIKNAWLVLTNSFHCTVFSIITKTRNFYTYIAPDSNRGSRIVDLLEIFSLSNHLINSWGDVPPVCSLRKSDIPPERIQSVMDQERSIGRKYLAEAFSITK